MLSFHLIMRGRGDLSSGGSCIGSAGRLFAVIAAGFELRLWDGF